VASGGDLVLYIGGFGVLLFVAFVTETSLMTHTTEASIIKPSHLVNSHCANVLSHIHVRVWVGVWQHPACFIPRTALQFEHVHAA
jgi:hypothetical protein